MQEGNAAFSDSVHCQYGRLGCMEMMPPQCMDLPKLHPSGFKQKFLINTVLILKLIFHHNSNVQQLLISFIWLAKFSAIAWFSLRHNQEQLFRIQQIITCGKCYFLNIT